MRGRFAPSPTGDLHLGGAFCAVAARRRADVLVLRIEDLDPPRVVPGATERILEDLAWLGIPFEEGPELGPHRPYRQSQRAPLYDAAVELLLERGLAYPCTCTRAEIARAASAPHAGEEGSRYPGICRDPAARRLGRPTAIRLRSSDPDIDDFVLRRADGIAAYQLAVVVDDLAMEVDEVVRGDDLLSSTPRQALLARMLGARPPSYLHVPMVLGPDGERLAKRHQARWIGSTVRELRELGRSAIEVLDAISLAVEESLRSSTSWKPSWIVARG
jgi:glutamyl-tRNA synthetase